MKNLKEENSMWGLKTKFGATDFAEMELLSSKNKNVTKYAWVKPLNEINSKTVFNAFIKIVNESNRKSDNLWVDQGREFYN